MGIKLQLIAHTPNPEEVIACSGKLCYSSVGVDGIAKKQTDEDIARFVNMLASIGHESPLEHVTFTFAVEGISRACYDDKTEVLTNDGWKLFKDLKDDEIVATYNKSNSNIEFHKINEKIQYDFDGNMHRYKSQNIDLLVTPNHKMLMKKYDSRTNQNWELVASEDIEVNRVYMTKEVNHNNITSNDITIDGYTYNRRNRNGELIEKHTGDLTFDRNTFFKFLAWYLSDGSVYYDKNENKYVISISQTSCSENIKNNTIEDIKTIISDMGLVPHYDGNSVRVNSLTLGRFLSKLGKSNEKYIPYNLFSEFSKENAKVFVDEYFRGDGHIDKNSCGKLYTTSKVLSNQLQTLCFIAGYTAKINIDGRHDSHFINGHRIKRNHLCYVVNVSMSGNRNVNCVVKMDKHKTEEYYKGVVYCVNVKNNTLFVRRNGVAMWCGNCSHQIVRHRIASFSQQSQRYVKLDNTFTYITPPEIEVDAEAYPVYVEAMNSAFESYVKVSDILTTKYMREGLDRRKAEKKAIEDARYVLPNSCETKMVFTMNARTLLNFLNKRCCDRSQWEIRQVAHKMLSELRKVCPSVFKKAGADCISKGVCNEGSMCCGKIDIINRNKTIK